MYEKFEFNIYQNKNNLRIKYNYRMNQVTNTFWNKEYRKQYVNFCGKKIMSKEEANLYISGLIESGKPFWVSRYGNTELTFIMAYLNKKYNANNSFLDDAFQNLQNNAGFFPNDITLGEKYVELILEISQNSDLHGMWPLYMEDYMIQKFLKDVKLIHYVSIEPWSLRSSDANILPWSHSLKGKKVLVIHPFDMSIKLQYENNRERIFSNIYPNADDILPKFTLKTLKAVQTIAYNKDARFKDWFEALNWMVEECKKIDFDVAILGCGAYGFPLAAEIKRMGKGAIQLCGATQLMFGILGKRWEKNANFQKNIVNDIWVHPNIDEQVMGKSKVEDSCYW